MFALEVEEKHGDDGDGGDAPDDSTDDGCARLEEHRVSSRLLG